MKIERTKNATRNIVFGLIVKIYSMAVPFLMRTLMIYFMGMQYLGLNSLFSSVLQVLNLTELGVGSAMVFSMYKPIAEDDTEKVCALMALYRRYYRIIGLVILVVGCAIIPALPYLIESDLPADINLYVMYGLNLGTTVFSYWLFAYRNCLLSAHQRNDVSSKISLTITTLQYGLQIVTICVFRNYYAYVIVAFATQILSNFVTAFITKKMYPEYIPLGKLEKSEVKGINRKIRDLFTAKIGGTVTYSVDTLVISAFLGLTLLGIYQNYYFIITSITGFFYLVYGAITAGIGNSIIVETKEKNYRDFKTFSFIIFWLMGFCTCCFLCLFQPFMMVWVGEEAMLDFICVILFCIYFMAVETVAFLSVYKDAAGVWHQDRFRPLVVALTNLILNIILVQVIGIYGIIISTFVASIFISIPWLISNIFHTIFDKVYLKNYIIEILLYIAISVIACVVTYLICYFLPIQNDWAVFFVRLAICMVVPNLLFLLVYFKKQEFKDSLALANRMTKGKIKFLRKFN